MEKQDGEAGGKSGWSRRRDGNVREAVGRSRMEKQ